MDIMMNDQTDVGAILQELDKAEGYYRRAKHHLILGSDGVLSRTARCLYEIAVRREASKWCQLLLVLGSENSNKVLSNEQVKSMKLDIKGSLDSIFGKSYDNLYLLTCYAMLFSILNVLS